jgi:hypothetical protein
VTILERRSVLARIVGKTTVGLATCVALAAFVTAAAESPARERPAPPEARAAQAGPNATRLRDKAAEPAQATKPTAVKAKPRPRSAPKAAKPRAVPAAKSTPTSVAKVPAASGKATQVMDFDPDHVEGTRLEPGFELIQAGPRRARQPSLVSFPPKPEDSVVNKQ